MKDPRTKLQAPGKLQGSNTKARVHGFSELEVGGLVFLWGLELGAWSFSEGLA